jgi:Arc/MetJ-type ribon-helix-helix transcriptional regulator
MHCHFPGKLRVSDPHRSSRRWDNSRFHQVRECVLRLTQWDAEWYSIQYVKTLYKLYEREYAMKNVQISFDPKLLDEVDLIVAKHRSSRSAIVREALRYWIRQQEIQEFEDQWIRKLKENPEDSIDAAEWMQIETWEEQ